MCSRPAATLAGMRQPWSWACAGVVTVTMVVSMVIVVMAVAVVHRGDGRVHTRAALGFEGLAHLGHVQVHGAQHVGQHVVGLDLQVIGLQLDRHVAVAQVVGRAHEVEGGVVVVTVVVVGAGGDAQHRLRCGHHAQQRTVLRDQHVTAAHHGAARQEHADAAAVRRLGVEAAFLAHIPVQRDGGGAAHQHRGQALALGDEFGDLQHGTSLFCYQNRKYRWAMGSLLAGSQVSSTPSARTV